MKRISKILAVTLTLVMLCSIGVSNKAYAASECPEFFDLGDQVISMDAGTTREVWLYAKVNYNYYIGKHSSKGTYIECSSRRNTENIKIHIGADEQEKNVFFYFYPAEDPYEHWDAYATLEVYVQNIKPALADPSAEVLKTYAGNNAEFNAYYYYVNYPDLQAAFGKNGDALLNHWNTCGKAELRTANKIK
ncbi:MAG: hypothetical protein IJI01_01945 [Butyrivibrio sp.]|uniref:hypothetical protein n=1 Tax=Butyrivibrio sp. TaxID=28121 RepID=UPI0025BFE632|nr:hypothetical protein [Butyrivibrio sp.]MBQ6587423.1 hypothetical protein [Butyrivibrio sp.]